MKIRRLFKTQQILIECLVCARAFQAALVVKNPPANAGDMGSIPGLGRYPGGGMAILSCILAWEIPGTAEPGGLQSMGLHRVGRH